MDKNIDRREFLKRFGSGSLAASGILSACTGEGKAGGGKKAEGKEGMTYRLNPKSGDKVSLLGYGCMRWPFMSGPEGENIDQQSVNELVDYAIAHGVNYFDTAPPYCRGLSEKATGIALKRHPRESYYIATKMSNQAFLNLGLSPKEFFDKSVEMYHKSFVDLQTDYIDYYLLHVIGTGNGLETLKERFLDNGVLDFLLEERRAGRIRNLGFSYHGDVKVFDYMLSRHEEFQWDFVQIQMNYVDWKHASGINHNAEYLYAELDKREIPVVVMEPLLGGRLASLPQHLSSRLKEQCPEGSIASWAFRFAGSFPRVLTVLSGMTYMEHLQDNLGTFSPLEECSTGELALLEDTALLMLQYPSVPCTGCQYCMPCPYGIDIPGIFAHYNKCLNEGQIATSSQDKNYRKARRAFLRGYSRSVERLRQADHCIGCGQCVSHCPQSIKIPHQLHRIDHYIERLKQEKL